MSIFKKTQ